MHAHNVAGKPTPGARRQLPDMTSHDDADRAALGVSSVSVRDIPLSPHPPQSILQVPDGGVAAELMMNA